MSVNRDNKKKRMFGARLKIISQSRLYARVCNKYQQTTTIWTTS